MPKTSQNSSHDRLRRWGGSGLTASALLLLCCAAAPGGAPSGMDGSGDVVSDAASGAIVQQLSGKSCGGGAQCYTLGVTCAGLPERRVNVRHYPVDAPRASVVLTSGGYGTQPYEQLPVKGETRRFLTDREFEVFQVEWLTKKGWVAGGEGAGFEAIMCGYAAVVDWIAVHKAGNPEVMCAQGNSGGALQIAYGLSLYDLGERLDMVILSGGPPVSRVDTYCVPPNADKLREQMSARSGRSGSRGGRSREGRAGQTRRGRTRVPGDERFGRTSTSRGLIDEVMGWAGQGDYCSQLLPLPEDELLFAQQTSLVPPQADEARLFEFPQTKVNFVGSERDQYYQKQGRIYFDAVGSDKAWYDIPGKPHKVDNTSEGAATIRDLMLSECRPR